MKNKRYAFLELEYWSCIACKPCPSKTCPHKVAPTFFAQGVVLENVSLVVFLDKIDSPWHFSLVNGG